MVLVLGVFGHHNKSSNCLRREVWTGRFRWLWPLVLPVLAAAATARIDNGRGNGLALGVVVAVGVVLPTCVLFAQRLQRPHLGLILYGSGLALMLLTSLRSGFVVGSDISTEYHDLHQTVLSGIWHTGHLGPYEAMLSLTVLPASLHALVGGQDVWIFKLGYPLLFALYPVALFSVASRFLSRRAAFLAATIVLVQSYFFQQQPEIARQEIGLLVFAVLVGVLLDVSLPRTTQLGFVALLSAALVVCHYSTTYVTIYLCLAALLIGGLISLRRRARLPLLAWLVAPVVMTVVSMVWYVLVTHSTSDITFALDTFRTYGIGLLPGRQKGQSVISAYFNGVRLPVISPYNYLRATVYLFRQAHPFLAPLPQASQPRYSPQLIAPQLLPVRAPGSARASEPQSSSCSKPSTRSASLARSCSCCAGVVDPRCDSWASPGSGLLCSSQRVGCSGHLPRTTTPRDCSFSATSFSRSSSPQRLSSSRRTLKSSPVGHFPVVTDSSSEDLGSPLWSLMSETLTLSLH